MQGILLQWHRDTEAAKIALTDLLWKYDVPEVFYTDQLRSNGAAIRKIPSLKDVNHQQVISMARSNNVIEQSHRPTRCQERQQRLKRAQAFLRLHARVTTLHLYVRTTASNATLRNNRQRASQIG